jgi:formamidopyrimidine-DNA glycosylase
MIELPEVLTLGRQLHETVTGRTVSHVDHGNSPHKFVWYSKPEAEYAEALIGQRAIGASGAAKFVSIHLESGWSLVAGDMGGRLLFHRDESTLPAKRHLLVGFEDGTFLSAAIQGWGGLFLWDTAEAAQQHARAGVDPLGPDFTIERLTELLETYDEREKGSVKAFLVQHPRIAGIGNGCLQDILYRAKLHPMRKVLTLGKRETRVLHRAIRTTLAEMAKQGGRDCERDLFGMPGGYTPVLDKRAAGRPCPACGTPIEKRAYLGGSIYFCSTCQV